MVVMTLMIMIIVLMVGDSDKYSVVTCDLSSILTSRQIDRGKIIDDLLIFSYQCYFCLLFIVVLLRAIWTLSGTVRTLSGCCPGRSGLESVQDRPDNIRSSCRCRWMSAGVKF